MVTKQTPVKERKMASTNVVTDVKILESRTITKNIPIWTEGNMPIWPETAFTCIIQLLEIFYIGCSEPKRFWCLTMNAFIHGPYYSGPFIGDMLYPENQLPKIIQQLYVVAGLRGSYTVYNDAQTDYVSYAIELHTNEKFKATGIIKKNLFINDINQYLSGRVAPMSIDSPRFRQIIHTLYTPMNRAYLKAIWCGIWWRALTKKNMICRRIQARTAILKAELMTIAWHPSRMVDWCLDTEDQADIKDMSK